VIALSPRQREILAHLLSPLPQHEISEKVGISLDGVNKHVRVIYAKCGAANRVDLMAMLMAPTDKAKKLLG
jgi:DNA-binding CsgD family transcriptional regulator